MLIGIIQSHFYLATLRCHDRVLVINQITITYSDYGIALYFFNLTLCRVNPYEKQKRPTKTILLQ